MEEKIKCLYYIKDLRTDKIIYIGQTTNYKDRKYKHFGHKETPIDLYMLNEGRNNFSMNMFDIDCTNMTEDERIQKEAELILQYDTINNGLNKRRSGNISKDINEYFKEYRKSDEQKTYHEKYRKDHKECQREYMRKYRQTEEYKERHREASLRYYTKKKQEKLANETS